MQTFLLAVAIFLTSVAVSSFRSSETIDINSDEATYAIESVAVQHTGVTKWNGAPFYVHPPMFFLIEGIYFKAIGIGNSPLFDRLVDRPYHPGQALLPADAPLDNNDVFHAIMAGRVLTVSYGAGIAVVLFLLGGMLLNRQMGLLAAGLIILDPYVTRRNHFNMLEPLATLFIMLTVYVYWRALEQPAGARRLRLLLSGFLFGLAMLSKELAILYVPALLVHAVLFRRIRFRETALLLSTSFAVYLVFPIWATLNGDFTIWWQTRTWGFRRLNGTIKDTGITRPGHSLGRPLPATLLDYWPSFLLLGVAGALAALFVYLYWRHHLRDRSGELLTALVIGCYGFFAVIYKIGGVLNEQFFYFIMPLAMLTVAYAPIASPHLRAMLAARRAMARVEQGTPALVPIPPVAGRPLVTGPRAGAIAASLAPAALTPSPAPPRRLLPDASSPPALLHGAIASLFAGDTRAATLAAHQVLGQVDGPDAAGYDGWANWVLALAGLWAHDSTGAAFYLNRAREAALQVHDPRLAMATYLAQQVDPATSAPGPGGASLQTRRLDPGELAIRPQFRTLIEFARASWPDPAAGEAVLVMSGKAGT